MNDLQVTVNQIPGVITWNFEELKQELASQMDAYKSIVYTDDNIGDAKTDVAALRKLSKAVNARKIEIKNKCLEPYETIEKQAKELMSLIDEPIRLISEKVDDYEKHRRAVKKAKIMVYMNEAFADLPDDIRKRLEFKTYDQRWENATATEKSYKDAIGKAHDETIDALRILQNIDEDFMDAVMETYKIDLNLTAAMMKAQELQKQKELVLERERIRREREMQTQASETAKKEEKPAEEKPVEVKPVQPTVEEKGPEPDGKLTATIVFKGTEEQLRKAVAYIKYIGAEYQITR